MRQRARLSTRIALIALSCVAALAAALALVSSTQLRASEPPDPVAPADLPDWVEPRALNVTDLVGQVPDQHLQGMAISSGGGEGLVLFESSADLGDTIVITTTIYPRRWNEVLLMGCLGRFPRGDVIGSAAPPSTLRLYDPNDPSWDPYYRRYGYTPSTITQPYENTTYTGHRYDYIEPPNIYRRQSEIGGLDLPGNMGCKLNVALDGRDRPELVGVFTLQKPQSPPVILLGTEQTTFHSYIGPGGLGHLEPLMDQMQDRFSNRHERFQLSPPEGSNYVLINYPPMPISACSYEPDHQFCTHNQDDPSSGTVRLEGSSLSTDLMYAGAFPLEVAWKDVDLSGGSTFLPIIETPPKITAPEYVVPPGIAWHDCFVNGGCSNTLLDQIHDTAYTVDILYLRVDPIWTGVDVLTLEMAGPGWTASSAVPELSDPLVGASTFDEPIYALDDTYPYTNYLPIIMNHYPPIPTSGCPCGVFNEQNQMIYLVP